MKELRIEVIEEKHAVRTVKVTDAQYEALKQDSPEDVLGWALFDSLYEEADQSHNNVAWDYRITDDHDRVLFDFDD